MLAPIVALLAVSVGSDGVRTSTGHCDDQEPEKSQQATSLQMTNIAGLSEANTEELERFEQAEAENSTYRKDCCCYHDYGNVYKSGLADGSCPKEISPGGKHWMLCWRTSRGGCLWQGPTVRKVWKKIRAGRKLIFPSHEFRTSGEYNPAVETAGPTDDYIYWTFGEDCYWTSKHSEEKVKASCFWHDKTVDVQRGVCPGYPAKDPPASDHVHQATSAMEIFSKGCTEGPTDDHIYWTFEEDCYWTSKYSAEQVWDSCFWHDKTVDLRRGVCPGYPASDHVQEATSGMEPFSPGCK